MHTSVNSGEQELLEAIFGLIRALGEMQDSAAFLENGMFHENPVIVEGSSKEIGFDLAAPGEKH
jgi:hypothetical protein